MTGLLLRGAPSGGFATAVGLAFGPAAGCGNRHAKLMIVNVSCTKLVLRGASGKLILSRLGYGGTSGKAPRRMGRTISLRGGAMCLEIGFDDSNGGVNGDRNKCSLVMVYSFDCDASNGGFRGVKGPFRTERNG